ncbi:hypothetical protein KR222_011084 [Zaprionus bogoriensis]|nr:hypothetical protein KR222_011084 [Zaprionus bogoriensis]
MHTITNTFCPSAASPTQILRRLLECIESGDDLRRELADDCIVSVLARSTRGLSAVTSFVRTQISGRFRHVDFQDARTCDAVQVEYLKERFGHSLGALQKRIKAAKKLNCPAPGLTRAGSVEELLKADAEQTGSPTNPFVTPPRSVLPSVPVGTGTDTIHYIESVGVLHPVDAAMDGGFWLGEPCQVKLTLGYRCEPPAYKGELVPEFCLIVYEKLKHRTQTPSLQRQPRLRSPRRVHTDDEGDESAPAPASSASRNVRRLLFAAADCDDLSGPDLDSIETPSRLAPPPRKRAHKPDLNRNSKRANQGGRLRF